MSTVRWNLKACGEVSGRNRWGRPRDEPVSPLVGQGRACYSGAKAFSFTHPLTKVIAGGTVRKNSACPLES